VSQLPRSWATTSIAQVTSVPANIDWRTWDSSTFTYVDIGSIDGTLGRIVDPKELEPAQAPARARQVIRAGDTVFSTVRTYLRNIAYIDHNLDGQIASTGFCVLRPVGVHPRYLFHYVRSSHFILEITAQQRGVSYPAVTDAQVRSMAIPIPPLAEQSRIVAAIEEQLSRIDSGVASLQSAAGRVQPLMASTIFAAIDERWPRVRLGDVADVALGQQRAPQHHSGTHPRPYIRAANITWSGLQLDDVKLMNFTPNQFPKFELRQGDVLLTEASGSASEVGKPAIWDGSIPGCCFQKTVLRLRSERLTSEYLYFLFLGLARQGTLVRHSKGVGIFHLTKERLVELEVPAPPRPAQDAMVNTIKQQQSLVAAIADTIDKQLKRAATLRSSILAAALSGRLVPQDPDDESASVLLERIAGERAASSGHGSSNKRARPTKATA
jgi:type I restriction enzyme, S subunit